MSSSASLFSVLGTLLMVEGSTKTVFAKLSDTFAHFAPTGEPGCCAGTATTRRVSLMDEGALGEESCRRLSPASIFGSAGMIADSGRVGDGDRCASEAED